jgi:hypothetical protein
MQLTGYIILALIAIWVSMGLICCAITVASAIIV